jgi:hypothetical protein
MTMPVAGAPSQRRLVAAMTAGLLATGLAAAPALARRLPAPGGRVSVALPEFLRRDFVAAHRSRSWNEGIGASRASTDFRTWVLENPWGLRGLRLALEHCLEGGRGGTAGPARDVAEPWPARALRTAGAIPRFAVGGSELLLHFAEPVGVVPELLRGCSVAGPEGGETPFVALGDAPLESILRLPDSQRFLRPPDYAPFLDGIDLVSLPSPADVRPGDPSGDPAGSQVGTQLAALPDVVLLLPPPAFGSASADPLDLLHKYPDFRKNLAPSLLLAVFHGGRGLAADGILPPGLGPSRPLPSPEPALASEAPLRLDPLPPGAPRLHIEHDAADPLLRGTVERLAVLLRARGWALTERSDAAAPAWRLLRWRAPSEDPALSLLSLAAELGLPGASTPALLDADPARRAVAAVELERAWIESRRVVPLMFADRWWVLHPQLRGVRIRVDGIPLLDSAFWADR